MLLRNLDADAGLCNGVRAIVIRPLPRVLDVLLISGSKAGTRVYIPRLVLAPKNPDLPFILRRRQLPVKLAWCMTLNKAQGQTLCRVAMYLFTQVDSHGQLYVGLSRAGSSKDVKVLVEETDAQGRYDQQEGIDEGVYTNNVVWPEALLQTNIADRADLRTAPAPHMHVNNSNIQAANNDQTATDQGFILDECTGLPQTPRPGTPEQTIDLHGTDDVDEFGAIAPECSASLVNFAVDAAQVRATIQARKKYYDENAEKHPDAEPIVDTRLLDELHETAVAHGITHSEWYEVSQKSIPEILTFLGALAEPSSARASSST